MIKYDKRRIFMPTIILITGLPCSGKTYAAKILSRKLKAKLVSSGEIIREEVRRRHLKYTPETDKRIADWFHSGGRELLIAARTYKQIKSSRRPVIIEGLRNLSQLKALEKLAKRKIPVIAIIANLKVRQIRADKRKRFSKKENIRSRDKIEAGHGLKNLIKHADFKVNNSYLSKTQFEKHLFKIIKHINT